MAFKNFELFDGKDVLNGTFNQTPIGGFVVLVDDAGNINRETFDAKKIKDVGNFLVTFLHRCGYDKPKVRIGRKTYEYIEPEPPTTYPHLAGDVYVYDDGETVVRFDPTDTLIDVVNKLSNEITVDEMFSHINKRPKIEFSRNDAINDILNYNQFSVEEVEKYKLVQVIQKHITKGHTTIPDDIRGNAYNKYGGMHGTYTKDELRGKYPSRLFIVIP